MGQPNSNTNFTFMYSDKPRLKINVFATDRDEGFHLITPDRSEHIRDLIGYANDGSQPFGKVQYIALSSDESMLALYTDADTQGTVIGLTPDLSREFVRVETG